MDENSPSRPAADEAALRAQVAALERRLRTEQTRREAAEEALRKAGPPLGAPLGAQTAELAEPGTRIQQEIDQRHRVEAALHDSEALYHSLVEHLPTCVYRIDLEGRITFGNSAYLKEMGRPIEELLGKTVFDMFPDEQARKYDADDRRVIATGQVFHDVEEHDVHGRKHYVEVLKSPVRDHRGQTVGVQGLYWDVTARKQGEQQLRKTMAELERSNKELEQFAAVASHDMHAPLRRIATASRTIQEQYRDRLDAEARGLLGFIVSGVEQMQELINDLLIHSRVGASDEPLGPVDAAPAVAQAINNLEMPIRESGAEIHVDRLPTVMANRTELVQLFQNLIDNAIKYRGQSPPRVEIRAEAGPGHWQFRVSDNGIGIAPEHREKVFETFHRLHGDEPYPGTGIGLATCKKIVERLDGKIRVESAAGQGSQFVFTLPECRSAGE